jgi:hypothetical protein
VWVALILCAGTEAAATDDKTPVQSLADGRSGVMSIRPTGEDITKSASTYLRNCLTRGATVGGDGEARQRAPEDVKAFVKRG